MKHYTDHELQVKIDTFLEKKMQKYPELNRPTRAVSKTAGFRWPNMVRLSAS